MSTTAGVAPSADALGDDFPLPAGVATTGHVATPDGLALFWRGYVPAAPRACLLFVHGLLEHSGRYRNPAAYFVPRGFACYAFDTRAHGNSPGVKMHVARFDDFLVDLSAVHGFVRERHPGLPLFLVGHSHGGLVLLRYALRHPRALPGIVLSSPFLAVHPAARPGPALQLLIAILARAWPTLMLPQRVDPGAVSRDPAVSAAYAIDPLNGRRFSARWAAEALRAQQQVLAGAGDLAVPALIMAAGADRVVDLETTRRFVAGAPAALVDFVVWDGLYHELFNEPEKQQVFARIEPWLEARLAAGAGAEPAP